MPRRKFDRQFKISAVKLVQQSGYSRAEAANTVPFQLVVNNQVRTHEGRFFNSTVNNPG